MKYFNKRELDQMPIETIQEQVETLERDVNDPTVISKYKIYIKKTLAEKQAYLNTRIRLSNSAH